MSPDHIEWNIQDYLAAMEERITNHIAEVKDSVAEVSKDRTRDVQRLTKVETTTKWLVRGVLAGFGGLFTFLSAHIRWSMH